MAYQSSPYKEMGVKASAVLTQRPLVKRLDRRLYDHNEPLMPRYGHKFLMQPRGTICNNCRQPIWAVQDKPCKGKV